tara:strand:- start:387 stop:617 length:231 start_codon:yes stop_codon:yes gene_type:complete
MKPRSRKNSFDQNKRKYSFDSIDSISYSTDNDSENTKTSKKIPIKKRRMREQPLEIKDPSPVPEKFKYLLHLQSKN